MAAKKRPISGAAPRVKGQFRLSAKANYPLERSIAHNLRFASREVMRALEYELARFQLPPGIWFFLRVLWEVPSIGQTELAERAGVMAPTAVTALDRMEGLGLIQRTRLAHDKRKFDVRLTAKGRELRPQLMPRAIDIVNVATAGLSATEVDELHRMLRVVIHNLSTANANVNAPPAALRGRSGKG